MNNKIAFISEHASPLALLGGTDSGGQNVYVGELAVHLVELGFQVDIFTRWDDPFTDQVVSYQPGVRVIHVQAGPLTSVPKEEILVYMDEFREDMLSFIASEGIDYRLIHANFWMSGLVAMQLKKILNIPFVITFHALGHVRKLHQKENDKFPPERVAIEEEIAEAADRIIAECPQDREDLIGYYHADHEKISIIPCGVSLKEFFPACKKVSRQLLGIEKEEKIILLLGRMVPRKGIDNVIRALALLDHTQNPVRLIIVGGEAGFSGLQISEEYLRLENLARELQVLHRITFTGSKAYAELKYYYSAADVFVTTPWYETFGITALESMACGTPVIGAEVGGIKYSVVNGKTGLLVPPHNPNALAERINLLLSNESLLKKMGEKAHEHVLEHFTWKKIAAKMKNIYDYMFIEEKTLDDEYVIIEKAFEEAEKTFRKSAAVLTEGIIEVVDWLSAALENGNKILICGNGGSAAESQHFAAELVGRFAMPYRKALPVISFNS